MFREYNQLQPKRWCWL